MRRLRRGARPRRTHCGTTREGNDGGADAAGLECRDLREWSPEGRCAAVQVYRTASHERSPPPRRRSRWGSPGAAATSGIALSILYRIYGTQHLRKGRHGGRRHLRKHGIGEKHAVPFALGRGGGRRPRQGRGGVRHQGSGRTGRPDGGDLPPEEDHVHLDRVPRHRRRRDGPPLPAGPHGASGRRGPRAGRPCLRRRLSPGASRRPGSDGGIPRTLLRHRPLRLPRRAEADRADDEGGEAGRGVDRAAQGNRGVRTGYSPSERRPVGRGGAGPLGVSVREPPPDATDPERR